MQYSTGAVFRLSRFTLNQDKLNKSLEKIILEIPSTRGKIHTGGAMQFDEYGDLWWGVGDNEDLINAPANSKDLRGKILRIRPIDFPDDQTPQPGVGSTYTVPAQNFGEFFSEKSLQAGENNRAEQFKNTTLVRPEIYAMGVRNPYTLTLDPVRRWVSWGDCGPDFNTVTEEDNLISEPGYFGYPYYAGNNISLQYNAISTTTPKAPTGLGGGISPLPPALPAIHNYQQACAMTGPIYRYDPQLQSAVKFPPHFDRIWFITEFNDSYIHAHRLDSAGKSITQKYKLTEPGNLFAGIKSSLAKPLDFQFGPDGALYVLNYGLNAWYNATPTTGLVKIEYIGPSCPVIPGFKKEKVGCTQANDPNFDPQATHHDPSRCGPTALNKTLKMELKHILTRRSFQLPISGQYRVQVLDLQGKILAQHQLEGGKTYLLSSLGLKNKGLGFLRFRVNNQEQTIKVVP